MAAIPAAPSGYITLDGGECRDRAGALTWTDDYGNRVAYSVYATRDASVPITDLRAVVGGAAVSQAMPLSVGEAASPADIGRILVYAPASVDAAWFDRGDGYRWPAIPLENYASVGSDEADIADLDGRVTTLEGTVTNLPGATFDLTKIPAQYVADMGLASANVMQCAARLPQTGEWYVSQSAGNNASGYESNTLSRLSADGTLLDSMALDGGGHGHTVSVHLVNGVVEVFGWTWDEPLTGGRASGDQLVKFNYVGGTTLTKANAGGAIKFLSMFDPTGVDYVLTACDWAADRIAHRVGHGDGTVDYYLRAISDVQAGVDKVLGHVGPLSTTVQYQGHTTLGGNLYRYLGTGVETNHVIERYDWTTGQLTATIDTNDLGKVAGVWPGGSCEPEGIVTYTDPISGRSSLIVGMSVNNVVPKRSRLYEFAQFQPDRGPLLRKLQDRSNALAVRRDGIWVGSTITNTANYSHTFQVAAPGAAISITTVSLVFDSLTLAANTTNYWVFKLQRTRAGVVADLASADTTTTPVAPNVPFNLAVSGTNIQPGDLITMRCNVAGTSTMSYPMTVNIGYISA